MIIRIPKLHPLLTYSANVMLRDCRAMLARELRRQRKIRRLKNAIPGTTDNRTTDEAE